MKGKRTIIFGALAAVLVGYVICIAPNFSRRSERIQTVDALKRIPLDRIETAAHSFAHDRKITDNAVSLHMLLSSGYLRPAEVRGLDQRDVSVTIGAERTPQAVLIRVRSIGGSDFVLLGDGSIQQIATKP
jgi:hypothetical protein